jgi:diguanylate cyclase (GGDEF)-like protein
MDVTTDAPAARPPPGAAGAHLLARRRERLRMLPMITASYFFDAAMLAGYAATGVVGWAAPVLLLGLGLMVCGGFHVLLNTQVPERFRDHHMVVEQMVAHCAVLTGFILWVPQVGAAMMMLSFVVFAFGALRMKFRSMVFAAMAMAVAMGLALAAFGTGLGMPFATPGQRAISSVWFAMVLSRLALLGQHGAHLRGQLTEQRARLTAALAEVERLAHRDELTGVRNRRAIMALVSEERDRMLRSGSPFAVALFDIDLFKRVNDDHGHLIGDEVLRRFADAASSAIRTTDRLGRFGGEEFLLLMPATPGQEAAMAAAERVRDAVMRVEWHAVDEGLSVTVSAGVSVARADDSIEALLGRADKALYAAKREGRNRLHAG